ncbi:MAG: DUF4129 domain-containing protein [Planctomycetes bacterium]|nr:DUF4129 domain-containing protein [Planctomycetota bacterium]
MWNLQGPRIDSERVREAVRATLLEPEFGEDPIRKLFRTLLEKLRELFRVDPFGAMSPEVRTIVLVALVIILCALLAHIGWSIWQGVRAATLSARRNPRVAGRTRQEWLADALTEARRAESAGEWLAAMRAYFTAAVVMLSKRGVLDLRPGFTHREILDRGGATPSDREQLAPLVRRLDVTWFGNERPTREDVQQFRSTYERLSTGPRGNGGAR